MYIAPNKKGEKKIFPPTSKWKSIFQLKLNDPSEAYPSDYQMLTENMACYAWITNFDMAFYPKPSLAHQAIIYAEFLKVDSKLKILIDSKEEQLNSCKPTPPAPFELNADLSNLPFRHEPLPSELIYEGRSSNDPQRIQVVFDYARVFGRVPSSVFTDSLELLHKELIVYKIGLSVATDTKVALEQPLKIESPETKRFRRLEKDLMAANEKNAELSRLVCKDQKDSLTILEQFKALNKFLWVMSRGTKQPQLPCSAIQGNLSLGDLNLFYSTPCESSSNH